MPRRSSGCLACRRRKIKCDEERPACQKCLNFRIECPGYERKPSPLRYRFKDQTDRVVSRASSEQRGFSLPEGEDRLQDTEASVQYAHRPLVILPRCRNPSAPASWQSQLYSAFLDLYLPKDDGSQMTTSPYGYVLVVSEARAGHCALDTALVALTAGQLAISGSGEDSIQLQRTSLEAYGEFLTQLNLALADPQTANEDGTLATIIVLALCEER